MLNPMDDALTPDAHARSAKERKPAAITAIVAATVVTLTVATLALSLSAIGPATAAPRAKPNQIKYEYVPPKDPAHQAIHDQMKQGRTLEHLQELLSPLRLPWPLTLKVAGCDGVPNAWYQGDVVTVCYELLAEILKNAPKQDLPIGLSRVDTIIGTPVRAAARAAARSP